MTLILFCELYILPQSTSGSNLNLDRKLANDEKKVAVEEASSKMYLKC